METRQNLTLYAGQDAEVAVSLTDDSGNPVLAAAVDGARWVVADRAGATDDEAVLVKLLGAGVAVTDGEAVLTVAADDVLPPGVYFHELALRTPDTKRFPVCSGLLYVRPTAAVADL